MSSDLDEQYFHWLYSQLGSVKSRRKSETYWSLLGQLHSTEFAWFIPNDDNRAEDGRDLRREFISEHHITLPDQVDALWHREPCTMLEMIVGLSRRLAFETESQPSEWFWHLMSNVGLIRYTDAAYLGSEEHINDVLESIIWRNYEPSGHGGLFPLRTPNQNQREVEIWYQLNAYLIENM